QRTCGEAATGAGVTPEMAGLARDATRD
ncbi:MAG: DUF1315 domain-containing protein, partial [Gammaproteobacteria bacterium]|nr:DUF1315 domain-containing protein [Gammaproteobacteria bacterium]